MDGHGWTPAQVLPNRQDWELWFLKRIHPSTSSWTISHHISIHHCPHLSGTLEVSQELLVLPNHLRWATLLEQKPEESVEVSGKGLPWFIWFSRCFRKINTHPFSGSIGSLNHRKFIETYSGNWIFWKNISQIGNLPQIGVNIKKYLSCHHLDNGWLFPSCLETSIRP